MDHDRLGDLFLLLGMASLGVGCGGVIPLEEDDTEGTDTGADSSTAPTDASASMTGDPTPGTTTTTDPTTTTQPPTGPSLTDSSTSGTTEVNFTDSLGTSSSTSGDSTTTGINAETTTTTGVIAETTTTGVYESTTYVPFTTGIFTSGFTSSGTGGAVVFEECADWAAQLTYCYFPMYPGFESFFRYGCNTTTIPDYYDYSAACGYAALQHYDCLSTLDCLEWPSLGMGTDCDGTLTGMEMQCGL